MRPAPVRPTKWESARPRCTTIASARPRITVVGFRLIIIYRLRGIRAPLYNKVDRVRVAFYEFDNDLLERYLRFRNVPRWLYDDTDFEKITNRAAL